LLYAVRIRQYSWNKSDTAYYREAKENFVSFNATTGKETIEVPKKPTVGQVWYEADSSWVYKIISVNANLSTPIKYYEDLVEVEASQLTGRDGTKYEVYSNFYARGIGYVGSIAEGKLISYLKEVKVVQ
jgi:hypothetical protein